MQAGAAFSVRLPSESHSPFHWLAIYSLGNAVQLHHVGPGRNPKVRRDISGGSNDADPFCDTPKREAVPLGQLHNVWNVAAIGGQGGKSTQRQYNLFKCDGTSSIVISEARHPKYKCLEIAQYKLCPFGHVRCSDCLCNRHPLPRSISLMIAITILNARAALQYETMFLMQG